MLYLLPTSSLVPAWAWVCSIREGLLHVHLLSSLHRTLSTFPSSTAHRCFLESALVFQFSIFLWILESPGPSSAATVVTQRNLSLNCLGADGGPICSISNKNFSGRRSLENLNGTATLRIWPLVLTDWWFFNLKMFGVPFQGFLKNPSSPFLQLCQTPSPWKELMLQQSPLCRSSSNSHLSALIQLGIPFYARAHIPKFISKPVNPIFLKHFYRIHGT